MNGFGDTILHPNANFSCMIFPRMDLFFIFTVLYAFRVMVGSATLASREEKTRSIVVVEYVVCLDMKHAPSSFLGVTPLKRRA
jgi:hypothetical protein